jgi:uncharacterized RDD family membrane protein YckC
METREIESASFFKRGIAFMVDDILVGLFLIIIFYEQLSGISSQTSTTQIEFHLNQFVMVNLVPIILLKVLYHTFFIWQGGKTLGKYIVNIKVIELESGVQPTLLKAFLRALVRVVSELFFYIGFIVALFLPLKQTMHDKLTNCVVVNG